MTTRGGGTIEARLVAAARAGDRGATDELLTTSLPLVYTIVRQVLPGDPDADDVVQDIMLRAYRQLPALRKPESFRSWLSAIAVNQISTHLRRRDAGARRSAPLDEATAVPDPDAMIEDLTVLQQELSEQRRQVVRAGYWLDPDDRVLLSLWLLEVAGELTRADLAAAIEAGIAHAGVRVQRMRRQLDLSRELVAALDARPRCPALRAAAADWDGTPSPLWRKRLTRHTRSCPVCRQFAPAMVPADRLLPGLVLLPVPIGLTAAVLGKTATASSTAAAMAGTSTGAGILGQLLQSVVAHPIAASVAAGALAAGAAVTVTTLPESPPPSSGAIAAPAVTRSFRTVPSPARPGTSAPRSPAAGPPTTGTISLAPGRPVSLESAADPGEFVTATAADLGNLAPVRATSADALRRQATFATVTGLADPRCFSFRTENGRYLRHASWRVRLDLDQGTSLFRGDATFCIGTGATAGTVTLEASNYPGWFLHHRGSQLWVDQDDASTAFRAETSFRLRPALAD